MIIWITVRKIFFPLKGGDEDETLRGRVGIEMKFVRVDGGWWMDSLPVQLCVCVLRCFLIIHHVD